MIFGDRQVISCKLGGVTNIGSYSIDSNGRSISCNSNYTSTSRNPSIRGLGNRAPGSYSIDRLRDDHLGLAQRCLSRTGTMRPISAILIIFSLCHLLHIFNDLPAPNAAGMIFVQ